MKYLKKYRIIISGGIIFLLFISFNVFFDKFSPKSDLEIAVNELTEVLYSDNGISNDFGKIKQVKVKNFSFSPYHDTLRFSCQLNYIHNFEGIFIRHQKKIVYAESMTE